MPRHGSAERTREEAACDVYEDVKMDSVVTNMDRIMNERITGTTNMGEISKNVQESRMKY